LFSNILKIIELISLFDLLNNLFDKFPTENLDTLVQVKSQQKKHLCILSGFPIYKIPKWMRRAGLKVILIQKKGCGGAHADIRQYNSFLRFFLLANGIGLRERHQVTSPAAECVQAVQK
jgi:hypothetical protein